PAPVRFAIWPARLRRAEPGLAPAAPSDKGRLPIAAAPEARVGVHWLRLFDEEGATVVRPLVVGTLPEVAETEPNDDPTKPQRLDSSCVTVNGKLSRSGDVDGFAVPLQKGQTLGAALQATRR